MTFLFTDVEGSTRLWEEHPAAMQVALARHDALIEAAIAAHGGRVFKTLGDAFCAAFPTASAALEAAVSSQRALMAESWGEIGPLRVRAALHTGPAEERNGDFFGQTLNRVARLVAAGYGDQILLSAATQDAVRVALPDGFALKDLGRHRLKDLQLPEQIYQLVVPDLPVGFPALKTLDRRPQNLPAQPTPLIGRDAEVTAVHDLLLRDDVRLVTLTGPGGTGKTRLGLQVAAELVDDFGDGAFFVPLAPVSEVGLVAASIAQALGVRETGGQSLIETLKGYLAEQALLLVLDNFEQVIDAAPLVADLLSDCPKLKVLVTSRALLQLRGEREFAVPPLGVPERGSRRRLPLDRLAAYPAVDLFVRRSQTVKPGFALTDENAPAVVEICHRLDGLPLAIELAAARSKILPPKAILTRLEKRLGLLTDGARDLPSRQQTLRAAIAWSYDLLDPAEQTLFARLAVFAGGCTLDAAEAVCSDANDFDVDVFSGVASLANKSLLRPIDPAEVAPLPEGMPSDPRFVMLQTIQEFGLEQLAASGEEERLRLAHADYFLRLAEDALAEPDDAVWLGRLEAEYDNLRAALAFLTETSGEAEHSLRLVAALGFYWYVRSYTTEGRGWLDRALERGDGAPAHLRAKALRWSGEMAAAEGDYERAVARYEEALDLFRDAQDVRSVAIVLDNLGLVATKRGDHHEAAPFHEKALALHREAGDSRSAVVSTNNLASLACLQGDFARGTTLYEEALALCRESGDRYTTALSLGNLAGAVRHQGDHERAATLYPEALTLWCELGYREGIADCLAGVAGIAAERGRSDIAARLFAAAEAACEAAGHRFVPIDRAQYERTVADTRATLGEEAFAGAWNEGQVLPLEEAIDLATRKER